MNRFTLAGVGLCLMATSALAENEFSGDLVQIAEGTILEWVATPQIVQAIMHQNTETAGFSESEILVLDQTWRDQTVTGGAMIDDLLSNDLSDHLRGLKDAGRGQFTEIFVTDGRGLNVGQSDITSDYWQGDEDKWQVPHASGGIHIGEVEFDESTQTYQSQISLPIFESGSVIGVITVGVDLQQLSENS